MRAPARRPESDHRDGVTGASDSVPLVEVSADAARRFLVTRHLLAPARAVGGGQEAVLEVFRRLGSIQFDPLSVAGRNHDLVLHARVAGYDPAWCEELLYVRARAVRGVQQGPLAPSDGVSCPGTALVGAAERTASRAGHPRRERRGSRRRSSSGSARKGRSRRSPSSAGPAVDWWWGADEPIARAVLEAYSVSGVLGLFAEGRKSPRLRPHGAPGSRRSFSRTRYRFASSCGTSCCHASARTACSARAAPASFGSASEGEARPVPAGAPVADRAARRARREGRPRRGRRRGCTRPTVCPARGGRATRIAARATGIGRISRAARSVRVGPPAAASALWLRLRLGGLRPGGEAQVGLLRAADPLPRPSRRPVRAADRPCRPPGAGALLLVGGRLRSAARRRIRRRDARGAAGVPRFAGATRIEWAAHLGKEKRLFLARP